MQISQGLFALLVTAVSFLFIVGVVTIVRRELRFNQLSSVLKQVNKREVFLILEVLSSSSPQKFMDIEQAVALVAMDQGIENPLSPDKNSWAAFHRLIGLGLVHVVRGSSRSDPLIYPLWSLTPLGRDLLNHWREEDSYGA